MKALKSLLPASFLVSLITAGSGSALDCQVPKTQGDMNQCAMSELERETALINKTYNDVRAKLDPARKQAFKDVQLAWIKYKDLKCEFETSGVAGGSAYSMVLDGCLAGMTRQRNKELEALGRCEEGDLSCPIR